MKQKNLSANRTIHSFFLKKLKNKKIKKIYSSFKNIILENSELNYCVAVSGGPDSMALAFLTMCSSIENNTNYIYIHIDHKLRPSSSEEALKTKSILKKFGIKLNIIEWTGKKKLKNMQEQARLRRYEYLFKKCKQHKINTILTAHHRDDLYENFFMRLLRGSGLNGLISFKKKYSKIKKSENIKIFRPLLNFPKSDLVFVAKNIFGEYIEDPSNSNDYFLRAHVRKILNNLDFNKNKNNFDKSLSNLEKSNKAIEYFIKKNIDQNVKKRNNDRIVINNDFFDGPDEIVFRSFGVVLNSFTKKLKLIRGKKVTSLINRLKNSKRFYKTTLSGCILKKVNNTLIITREI